MVQQRLLQSQFFLSQAMNSMATNTSVFTGTSISDGVDLNCEVILTLSLTHCVNGPLDQHRAKCYIKSPLAIKSCLLPFPKENALFSSEYNKFCTVN